MKAAHEVQQLLLFKGSLRWESFVASLLSPGFDPMRDMPAPYSSSALQNGGYSNANTKSLWGVPHPLNATRTWPWLQLLLALQSMGT